jgi:hypothetical protein
MELLVDLDIRFHFSVLTCLADKSINVWPRYLMRLAYRRVSVRYYVCIEMYSEYKFSSLKSAYYL